MKTKLLFAALCMTFSAQSFATGSIDCTANGINSKGKAVTMNIFTNTGYDAGSELASNVQITPDASKKSVIEISPRQVTEFKNSEKQLLIKVVDKAGVTTLLLSYNPKKEQGSLVVNQKGKIQVSSDVTCNYDF